MLGGADMNKLFSLKILEEAGKNKLLQLNILDRADMKNLFSVKMVVNLFLSAYVMWSN